MNKLRCVMAGLCFLPLVAVLTAQQPEKTRRPADGLLPPGIIEKLDLTEAQKEKVTKMHKDLQEKLEAAKKKFAEALEQAKQNQDRQRTQAANEALQRETAKLQDEFHSQLQQVLTAEQRERLAQQRRDQPGKVGLGNLPQILRQLELSEEQRDRAAKLIKELQEKQEAAQKKLQEAIEQAKQNLDRQKVRELAQAAEKEIGKLQEQLQAQVEQLLTEAQKKTYAELRQRLESAVRPAGVGQVLPPPLQERLGLTPEQKTKIDNLQKEVDSKLREILTEQQNKTLEQFKGGPSLERRKPKD